MIKQLQQLSLFFAFALCCILQGQAAADDDLNFAAFKGDVAEIKRILRAGTDVDIRNHNNETPLINAAARGHAPAVKVLISAGANVNAQTGTGYSPLHAAADNGHSAVVVALIRGNADVNLHNSDGHTPLHFAAKWGFINSVNALIKAGADVNAKSAIGNTPLHLVSANMRKHANIRLWPDKRGKVPLEDYKAVIDALKEAGAKR